MEKQANKKQIQAYLYQYGLSDFKWIDPKDIVVAQWVRVKCEFGCSDYGLGTCPPNTPNVQECRSFFNEYSKGLIIRLAKYVDKENYPSDWSKEMTDKLLRLERMVFLDGFQKAFLLNQTCCCLCSECSGNRLHCKMKRESRPSPEAFAVDVYQTVRNAGMKINVVKSNPSEIHRIAILLIE